MIASVSCDDFCFRLQEKFRPSLQRWIFHVVLFWVKFSLILFTVQLSLLSTRFHSWLIHFKIQAHKSQTVFLQFLKILHLHFTNNIPAMRNEMRISPKQDPGLMAVESLRIYFHISRFWVFNRILLSGKISLNRSPHFFIHTTTP